MLRILLVFPGLLAACGGGGGGGVPLATLGGSVTALSAIPQAAAQGLAGPDAEPNDFAACARLAREAPRGSLDAATDPIDVFRYVAGAPGRVSAVVEATGVDAEVALHDLETGRTARTLDLEAGSVYDVVVTARTGAGTYRVTVAPGGADVTPCPLPDAYRTCGDGHVPDQIVAAPADGVTPADVAAAGGLACVKDGRGICLLAAPAAGEDDEFRAMCGVLARCARLESEGLVRFAEPNFLRRLSQTPNDPLFGDQYGLTQIRAPLAWDEVTASPVIIAVVDSGIRAHPDVVNQLVEGYDFVDDDPDPTDPTPSITHGTQTAGVACASGNNAEGVAGVLWDGLVMPLRAFDTNGFGTSFDISSAIRHASGESVLAGVGVQALVINLSFASVVQSVAERESTESAYARGSVLFAATGNDGSMNRRYPAAYDNVNGVTATGDDERVTGYSSHGDWVTFTAPGGTAVRGVRCPGINAQTGEFDYVAVNGTSFACPHACGVAAMMLTLDPTLTPDDIRQILMDTAVDIEEPGFDVKAGYGRIDAYDAVLTVLGRDPPLTPGEQVLVRLLRSPSLETVFNAVTSDAVQFAWELQNVPPGDYVLLAGTDRDNDGVIMEAGEVWGFWQDAGGNQIVTVDPGQALTDLDIVIAPQ